MRHRKNHIVNHMDHGYWSWRFNWFYVFDKQLKAENLANRVVLKNTSEKHLMKLT